MRIPVDILLSGREERATIRIRGGGGRSWRRDKDSLFALRNFGRENAEPERVGRPARFNNNNGWNEGDPGGPGPSLPSLDPGNCAWVARRGPRPSPGQPTPQDFANVPPYCAVQGGTDPMPHGIRQIGGISQAPGTHACTVHSGETALAWARFRLASQQAGLAASEPANLLGGFEACSAAWHQRAPSP